VKQTDRK